jgi:hypothetical protein
MGCTDVVNGGGVVAVVGWLWLSLMETYVHIQWWYLTVLSGEHVVVRYEVVRAATNGVLLWLKVG